jgi:hypothetical protein
MQHGMALLRRCVGRLAADFPVNIDIAERGKGWL